MSCSRLEARLERFVFGELEPAERRPLERHLERCPDCRDLVELARIAGEPAAAAEAPAGFLERVLSETAGSSCGAAEHALCAFVDEELDAERSELVGRHLAVCGECSALARALAALGHDLPALADIRPDRRFVATVLAATLPLHVRVGRWWRAAWPRWLRRPRFAMEAAYVATLALVLIFATPMSPLEAMPRRAVEAVQSVPAPELGSRWQRASDAVVSSWDQVGRSDAARAVVGSWRRTLELGESAAGRSTELAGDAADWTVERIRTFWAQAASLMERADGDSTAADPDTNEETK